MADQFGYRIEELTKIERDFQTLNQRMEQMTKQVGSIKATIAKAAAEDVFSAPFAGIFGFSSVVGDVVKSVKEIEARADHLEKTKETLTKGLAQDVDKIRKVISHYQAIEKKIAEEMNKPKGGDHEKPKSPGTGTRIDGGAGGKGGEQGSGGGGSHHPSQPESPGDSSGSTGTPAGGPGGRHDGPKLKDKSTGDWKTKIFNGSGWDSWCGNRKRHKQNGEGLGVVAKPKMDGLSPERTAIVERALERAEHKLGYSQGAITNGYRVDCSGLVSAAWGLPGPGRDTHGLMASDVSEQISKNDLKPGDAMIMGEHTVLFGGWADAAHTKYIGIEDSGDAGCVSREIPYPYFHGDQRYHPFRRKGVE
ncbi:hypothetical protein AB0K51_19335 [Kitasatospora sp. NPDC049285]|uniref:hypothetical protein n=1 Tax=Kitasatospora sp. NPDC049285 TaxID=3157096 RepID=UPI00344196A2